MKNAMRKIVTMVLVLILTATMLPTARAAGNEEWTNNVLTSDPLGTFDIKLSKIASVTFLDSTENAPRNRWHMGAGSSRSVLGWIEWNDGYADVYFAADGGINAEKCAVGLFQGCENLVEIDFNDAFHTEHCTSMQDMFYGCASLRELDLSSFDTSNVESMYGMFRDCASLKELDVSSFDTSNVKTMYTMFSTCTHLTELDLSGFDTGKVTNMGFMFSACRRLEDVDVSGFDTAKVTNMEGMFRWCDEIEDLDLKDWNISRVRNYTGFMNDGMHINGRPWIEFFE